MLGDVFSTDHDNETAVLHPSCRHLQRAFVAAAAQCLRPSVAPTGERGEDAGLAGVRFDRTAFGAGVVGLSREVHLGPPAISEGYLLEPWLPDELAWEEALPNHPDATYSVPATKADLLTPSS